ncbi:hypothetical protein EJ05DRAFT_503128 [Pseudovirgaria hyperparasitica]|uniref:Uncharacterized protein n=1 Tax=Pseudovirgaria hyperparasitica TaxID=470096 RepID=A0A6A6W3Q2_9PEZI|nr:uncharacterized protein EJ05DRAFT_503128 [Pseudovirgaria hyperparasitica]KAF2755671.1 hypothetical protein EJ05DRAFT_503128 [Pseudovirgaria hyperparasitica]
MRESECAPQSSPECEEVSSTIASAGCGHGLVLSARSSRLPNIGLLATIGIRCREDPSDEIKIVPLRRVNTIEAFRTAARKLFFRTRSMNYVRVYIEGQVVADEYWLDLLRVGRVYVVSFVPAIRVLFSPRFKPGAPRSSMIKVPYKMSVWELRGRIHSYISQRDEAPPIEQLTLLNTFDKNADERSIVMEDMEMLSAHVTLAEGICYIATFWKDMPQQNLDKAQWFSGNPHGVEDVDQAQTKRPASPCL